MVTVAMVERLSDFGTLPDGTPIPRYALSNGHGLRAEVIALGGVVTRLETPDRDGKPGDVLLGPTTAEAVLKTSPSLGALIGRFGNRIGHGQFDLDGKTYTLHKNNGPNTLHGGLIGYDKRLWTIAPATDGSASLVLTLNDPDGNEGFPGTLKVTVTYTLTPQNAWRIDYAATTDAPTPVNLTQHAYFNLKDAGKSTILDHVARVDATQYTPSNAELLPTGKIEPVAGTPFDFIKPRAIGSEFSKLTNTPRGIDHNFVIEGQSGTLRSAAEIYEPTTGRVMQVFTTEPGIQFYTGNFLNGSFTGTDGVTYKQHAGLCLETQHYPDSPNRPEFPTTILRPGQTFHSTTEYRFSVR